MIDIYSLFNIPKEQFRDFPLLANRVIDHQIEKVVNKNIDGLKQIKDRMLVDKGLEIPQRSIEEVISKVLYFSSMKDDSLDNWSNHELRIISYYLMKLRNNAKDYYFALSLLDNGWRNLFFNGLVFYLMNSWNAIKDEYREATCRLVVKKLSEYKDIDWECAPYKINYGALYEKRYPLLKVAFKRFVDKLNDAEDLREAYKAFCDENSFWLEDYALFMTVKGLNDGVAWIEWPENLKKREAAERSVK